MFYGGRPNFMLFLLKLATGSLATGGEEWILSRRLACSTRGMEPEDGYHAVMLYTKAHALLTEILFKKKSPEEELLMSGWDWSMRYCNEPLSS